MSVTRPRVGDRYQLRDRETHGPDSERVGIVAEVKAISGSWVALEVQSDDLAMHWRDTIEKFRREWVKLEPT